MNSVFSVKRPFTDWLNVFIIIIMWAGLTGLTTEIINEHYPEQKKEVYTALFLVCSFILYTRKEFLFY